MSKIATRYENQKSSKQQPTKPRKKRSSAVKIKQSLDRYHAAIKRISKGVPPFSAAEEQREIRRRELGE